jgi:hypothetical protein
MADEEQPPGSGGLGFSGVVPVVASSVTVAGSILGTLGVSTGVITALLRNTRGPTIGALLFAGVGVVVGVVSALGSPRAVSRATPRPENHRTATAQRPKRWAWLRARWRGALAIASLILFGAGIFWLVYLAAGSLRTTQRPAIVATVSPLDKPVGYATLEATVTASGMTTDERYLVIAEMIADKPDAPTKEIFRAFAGAKSDGTFEYNFKVAFKTESSYPMIGITAHLQKENEAVAGFQKCGLPESATKSNSPGSNATASTVLKPPVPGTTCTVAAVPLTTTTTTTRRH